MAKYFASLMTNNFYQTCLIVEAVFVDGLLKRVRLPHESHHDGLLEVLAGQALGLDGNAVQKNLRGFFETGSVQEVLGKLST